MGLGLHLRDLQGGGRVTACIFASHLPSCRAVTPTGLSHLAFQALLVCLELVAATLSPRPEGALRPCHRAVHPSVLEKRTVGSTAAGCT